MLIKRLAMVLIGSWLLLGTTVWAAGLPAPLWQIPQQDEGGTPLALSQTITLVAPETGLITTVHYPEAWLATVEDGAIMIASSQTALDTYSQADVMLGGDDRLIVLHTVAHLPDDAELEDFFVAALPDDTNIVAGEALPVTLAGMAGWQATISSQGFAGLYLMVQTEENLVTIMTTTASDNTDDVHPLLEAMLAALEVVALDSLPALTETFMLADAASGLTLEVRYPADWTAIGQGGIVFVATSEAALGLALAGEALAAGEAVYAINVFGAETTGGVAVPVLYRGIGGGFLSEPMTIVIGDVTGVQGTFTGPIGGNGGTLVMLDYEGNIVMGVATVRFTAPGKAGIMLAALLASITVSEASEAN